MCAVVVDKYLRRCIVVKIWIGLAAGKFKLKALFDAGNYAGQNQQHCTQHCTWRMSRSFFVWQQPADSKTVSNNGAEELP